MLNDLEKKGVKVDTSEMSDKKFPESLVGPKTGNGVVLQLTGWKEGPFDATYDGCERLCEKYTQNPKLKLVAGNQLKNNQKLSFCRLKKDIRNSWPEELPFCMDFK